jgi:hypothetical protein
MGIGRVILGTLVSTAVSAALAAHPIHTTLTELEYRGEDHTVRLSLRAFADDFGTAASRHAGIAVGPEHRVPDGVAVAYANATVTLTDRGGRRLPLSGCGVRRGGDLLWLCLAGTIGGGLAGAQVHVRTLFDLHHDQVNLVQVTNGSRRQSLLFTRKDPPKALR